MSKEKMEKAVCDAASGEACRDNRVQEYASIRYIVSTDSKLMAFNSNVEIRVDFTSIPAYQRSLIEDEVCKLTDLIADIIKKEETASGN